MQRKPTRLPRCSSCGHVTIAKMEYCPECGLRRPRGALEPVVKPFLPTHSATCLRSQVQQIQSEQERIRTDLERLTSLRTALQERCEDARAQGRDERALAASLRTVDAAHRQRENLRDQLDALRMDLSLDRLESDLLLLVEQLNPLSPGVDPFLASTLQPTKEQGAVRFVVDHPLSSCFAVGYETGPLRLADFDSLAWCGTLKPGQQILSIAFSRLHQLLVLGTTEPNLQLWDLSTRSLLDQVPSPQALRALAWRPDASAVVALFADGQVATLGVPLLTSLGSFSIDRGPVVAAALDPANDCCIVAQRDRSLRRFRLSDGSVIGEFTGLTGSASALALDPTGRWLASCDEAGEVRLWGSRGEGRSVLTVPAQKAPCLTFSPEGEWLAVTSGASVVVCKHQQTHSPLTLKDPEGRIATSLALSPNGQYLAVGTATGEVLLWDLRLAPARWKVRDLLSNSMQALEQTAQARGTGAPSPRLRPFWTLLLHAAVDHLRSRVEETPAQDYEPTTTLAEIKWLTSAFDKHSIGAFAKASTADGLRAVLHAAAKELPLRPFARSLIALREQAVVLLDATQRANESECREIVGRLRASAADLTNMVSKLNGLPASTRDSEEGLRIGQEVDELRTRLASLEDAALARLALLAVQRVSPLHDHAMVDRLQSSRVDRSSGLSDGATLTESRPRRLSSRRVRAINVLQRLDQRQELLRNAREELDRIHLEADAVDEVKKIRNQD